MALRSFGTGPGLWVIGEVEVKLVRRFLQHRLNLRLMPCKRIGLILQEGQPKHRKLVRNEV